MAGVAVCIVTHNSAVDLPSCLEAVSSLEPAPAEIVVVDCASVDESHVIAASAASRAAITAVRLDENVGFAGGMNVGIAKASTQFVLALNPDARPEPDYLAPLVAGCESSATARVGAVTGRLVRPREGQLRLLDAAGMYLTNTWRHLDRGSSEVDHGQYFQRERVFGATGAATLFARRALEDVAIDGEYFLEEFHSFREDAELCLRLRERGWEVLYEPRARCVHNRSNLPDRRRQMAPEVNYHSLKNRYLLRFYHQTPGNLWRTAVPALWRDLGILIYVLLRERSSFPAYRWLWTHRRQIRERRRIIQSRRTVSAAAVDIWFRRKSLPL